MLQTVENNATRPQFADHRVRQLAPTGKRTSTRVFLAVLLGVCLILAWFMLRFFWRPMVFAGVVGIGFYPVHAKLQKLITQQNASALISTLFVLLIFVVSAIFFTSALSDEIIHAAQYVGSRAGQGANIFRILDHIVDWLARYMDVEKTGIRSAVYAFPARISGLLFAIATTLVTGLATFLGEGVSTLFILFFVFRDGAAAAIRAATLLPVEHQHIDRLFSRIRDNVFANLYGILAVALAQGLLTGAAFAALGISSPILFGIAAAVCSLVPVVGPSIVWLPASIFFFATGHWIKGLILIAWGAMAVGAADNIIRPFAIMGRVNLHPLVLLFALIGGVQQFGFAGLFIGPVTMSVIAALVDMLQKETVEAGKSDALSL